MKAIPLFPEPFDLDEVERALDSHDFVYLAYIVMGGKDAWDVALDQTARLVDAFEEQDRDWRKVYNLVTVLIARAETFDDTGAYLSRIETAIGILPGTALFDELRMAHLYKIDPHAWQRKTNQQWLENYRKRQKIFRPTTEDTTTDAS
jgi:hypothetical protein